MDQHKKDRAEQLLNDSILNDAIDDARQDYLEQLVDVEPLNMEQICKLQGTVRALDDITTVLRRYMLSEGDFD